MAKPERISDDWKELEENLNLSRTIEAGSFYAVNVERWRSITDMLPRLIARIREQDEEIRRLWRLLEDVRASAMCDDEDKHDN